MISEYYSPLSARTRRLRLRHWG